MDTKLLLFEEHPGYWIMSKTKEKVYIPTRSRGAKGFWNPESKCYRDYSYLHSDDCYVAGGQGRFWSSIWSKKPNLNWVRWQKGYDGDPVTGIMFLVPDDLDEIREERPKALTQGCLF